MSKLWRFEDKRINEALEIATSPGATESYFKMKSYSHWKFYSLPDPMAMPMSAAVKAFYEVSESAQCHHEEYSREHRLFLHHTKCEDRLHLG